MVQKIKASLVVWVSWWLAGCTGLPGEGRKDTGGSDSAGRETDSGHADSGEAETGETGMAETGDSDRDSGETGGDDTETSDTAETAETGDSDELLGAAAKLIGEEAGDYAGAAVAALGDVDGDGRADMLVAAPEHESATAYLVLGPATGRSDLGDAAGRLTLEVDGTPVPDWSVLSGSPIHGAGDVDGDGSPDLVLGTPAAGDDSVGVAWLGLCMACGLVRSSSWTPTRALWDSTATTIQVGL